eukprot:m.23071 g.23071  ORF g.23071 m.23071 type:complete len:413 (+) comp8930_c0_seq2:46-1284(+)
MLKSATTTTAQTTVRHTGWEFWKSIGAPKFVCAPMVLQSETAFRRFVVEKGGCDLAYTPMMHADHFACRDFSFKEHLEDVILDKDHPYPLIAQFCATSADDFVAAAKEVEEYVDAVDLNLGCPQTKAEKEGFGAFMMDKPEIVKEIVTRAASELRVPICCKIRIFHDDEKTIAFAKMLQDAGCSVLTVHGRKREQRHHEGVPSFDLIRRIVDTLHIPVIANGAVDGKEKALEVLQMTGACAVMAASHLLKNPILFTTSSDYGSKPENAMKNALQYLSYAQQYPPPTCRHVRDHLLKILRPWLSKRTNMDLHNMIGKNKSVYLKEQFERCIHILADRIGVDLHGLGLVSETTHPLLTLHDIKCITFKPTQQNDKQQDQATRLEEEVLKEEKEELGDEEKEVERNEDNTTGNNK